MIFNTNKGNFAIIFSSIFGFFLIISLFYVVFFSYQSQIESQLDLFSQDENPYAQAFSSYSVESPYEFMGRTQYRIKNTGDYPLQFETQNGWLCFDIFSGNSFFDNSLATITAQNYLPETYREIRPSNQGSVFLLDTTLERDELSFTSCNGISFKDSFEKQQYFWWNNNWEERTEMSIGNRGEQYDANITKIFDETQINFTQFRRDDLNITISLDEYSIYELPFDKYSQVFNETSPESQEVILGNSNNPDNQDPTNTRGVLFDGLSFNGNQYFSTNNFQGLSNSQEATISFWVKDNNLGVDEQILFNEEVVDIKTDETNPEDLMVIWNFGNNFGNENVFTNVLENNTWQFITITLNQGETCVYVNAELNNCLTEAETQLSNSVADLYGGITDPNIGGNPNIGAGNGYSGTLDELTIFSVELENQEIEKLSESSQLYRELPYTINNLSVDNQNLNISVVYPKLLSTRNVSSYLYYDR